MDNKINKSRDKKSIILKTAIKTVNTKGFEKATMEEIATELKMTKGSLYYYFKNKNDLMYQCHYHVLSQAIEIHEKHLLEKWSPSELLAAMISTHIDFAIDEKEIFNMIIEPKRTFEEGRLKSVLSLRKQYGLLFDEVIRRGIALGYFNHLDVSLVRNFILGALNWIQQWFDPHGKYSKGEIKKIYTQHVLSMLGYKN